MLIIYLDNYPYPFAPTWDSSITSQSRRSWPVRDGTSRSSGFPQPTIAASPRSGDKYYERPGSIRSVSSWARNVDLDRDRECRHLSGSSTARNSSLDAEVSHFSMYSSQKSMSTMKFREPTPPPPVPTAGGDRPRVPQTLQPREPVPQDDFDRFTTTSSQRGFGRAL